MDTERTTLSVAAALERASARLRSATDAAGAASASAASAALDAQLLLAHVLARPRSALLAHGEDPLSAEQASLYDRCIERRAHGEPLAYIIGRKSFWTLELQVTPAVLVPRPETELLVERCLALLPGHEADVVDLGTGSGAIALALASERPRWRITATDQSAAALAVAETNARALGIGGVRFLAGDWFAPLAGRRFDLIASNPPYIAAHEAALDDSALRHEPHAALSSGPTGLEALTVLIRGAAAHLTSDGWLVLEHGAGQPRAVAELLVAQGFRHVRCHADLAGLPRITEAQRPPA